MLQVHWKGTESHPTPEENEKVAGEERTCGQEKRKEMKTQVS